MKYQFYEYVCIREWGTRLGSFNSYIVEQQKRAAAEGAPITAIYRNDDGTWEKAEDIRDPWQRRLILRHLFVEEEHGQYGTEYDVASDKFDRLPRACAAYMYASRKGHPIMLYRGLQGYTELPDGFDVDKFNKQRRITAAQVEAMRTGSMFGFNCAASDPANCEGLDLVLDAEKEV